MCGRYAQYSSADAIADLFGAAIEIEGLAPRYNAAPMQWLPVILAPDVVDVWLDRTSDPARLSELLMPFPEERLAMHPVSRAVGNVRNEGQELIAEVSDPSPAHREGDDPSGRARV
ncbi:MULTISPECIES: SOS response-associated peptidase family protein [unclassified Thiocapsa]|uniref:SOS response-associated peptidase family protein n=1 Tax=unclassified Thiocapsa TaxID=2641286 RepID=UPI0035ADDED7